jgi:hypothetical protein
VSAREWSGLRAGEWRWAEMCGCGPVKVFLFFHFNNLRVKDVYSDFYFILCSIFLVLPFSFILYFHFQILVFLA